MRLFSALVIASLLVGAVSAATADTVLTVEPWPEADRLFRKKDSRWVGGSGAASIRLGDGYSMWLFHDCVLSNASRRGRRTVRIDNAIAIQNGSDPATATIEFVWRENAGAPASFFPRDKSIFYQPTQGVLIDDRALVFMTAFNEGDTGNDVVGWSAAVIMRHGKLWRTQLLTAPESHPDIILGTGSALLVGAFVYAFGVHDGAMSDSATNSAYVARWPASDAAFGDLSHMQWWTGETRGWVEHTAAEVEPVPVIRDVSSSFTVHYENALAQFLLIGGGVEAPRTGMQLLWWSSEYLNNEWQRDPRAETNDDLRTGLATMVHPQLTGADLVLTRVDDRGATHFYRVNITP